MNHLFTVVRNTFVNLTRPEWAVVTCAEDTRKFPDGFFLTKVGGKVHLSYKDMHGWIPDVPEQFTHPVSRVPVKLSVPRAALRLFVLNMRNQSEGIATVGNLTIVDTEVLTRNQDVTDGRYQADDPSADSGRRVDDPGRWSA
jgi:hypothetical protein